MAITKASGRPSFLERLQQQRQPEVKAPPKPAADPAAVKALVSRFEGTDVGATTASSHGEHLVALLPELKKLSASAQGMPALEANALHHGLKALFDALGKHLDQLPEAARGPFAAAAVQGTQQLFTNLEGHRAQVSAVSAAAQLVEATASLKLRGKLKLAPNVYAESIRAPFAAVEGLIRRVDGRSGTESALNVFAVLCGRVEENAHELSEATRRTMRAAVADYLVEAAPLSGFDSETISKLAGAANKALVDEPHRDFEAALKNAKLAFWAQNAPARDAVLGQLAALDPRIVVGSPEAASVSVAQRALSNVVAQNPAGPQRLFDAVRDLQLALGEPIRSATNTDAVMQARELVDGKFQLVEVPKREAKAPDEAFKRSLHDVLSLVAAHGGSAAAPELFELLATNAAALLSPAAGDAVHAAAAADHEGAAASALMSALVPPAAQGPELDAALARLAADRGPGAFRALAGALARAPDAGTGALLSASLEYFVGRHGAPAADEQARVLAELPAALDQVRALFPKGAATTALAVRLAQLKPTPQLDPAQLQAVLAPATAAAPDLVASLFFAQPGGAPGLVTLADPGIRHRNGPPAPFYAKLAAAVGAGAKGLDAVGREQLMRAAAATAWSFSNLDGVDIQRPFEQSLKDFTAAVNGQPLQGKSAVQFFAAHPELPPELAATAGLHLNADQLEWLSEGLEKVSSREQVRTLRNFVMGCIATGHLDMIDTVRLSPSTSKVRSSTITSIGHRYRVGEPIEWDAIAAGMKAGTDPVSEISERKAAEALKALGPAVAAPGGVPVPGDGGRESLKRAAAQVAAIQTYVNNAGYEDFRQPFADAIKAAADGNWPAARYESEVGKRHLKLLSPAQQKLWRTRMVTPVGGQAQLTEVVQDTTPLAAALVKALPQQVPIGGVPGLKLKWDQASADALRARRDAALARFHAAEKGSDAHRVLSKELGPELGVIRRNLAAIELYLALSADAEHADVKKLAPVLDAATAPLRAFGADGTADAVALLKEAAEAGAPVDVPKLGPLPDKGKFAVDEDDLASLISSHIEATCLNPLSGQNRYALVVGLTNPNYRIARVINDGKQMARCYVEFFKVKFGNYEGPALWVDRPNNGGGGSTAEFALLFQHLLGKAVAMGIPLLLVDQAQQAGPIAAQGNVKPWWGAFEGKVEIVAAQKVALSVFSGTSPKTHVDNVNGASMYGRVIPAQVGDAPAVVVESPVQTIFMPVAKGA